jgi:sirohydrochlorin ferrochelatase
VAVASYLLAPGRFAGQVRDEALAAGAAVVSAPLGAAPELADIVLTRYAAARAGHAAAAAARIA